MMRDAAPFHSSRKRRPVLALLLIGFWTAAAEAQIVLPGAVAPTPEGAPEAPRPKPSRPRGEAPSSVPAPAIVPSPSTLGGKTLLLNGGPSQITFAVADKQLTVSRLVLSGTMISNPRATCQVQADATPLAATGLGRPLGVERIQIAYPACPIVFDVLDGAVLVDTAQGACEFKAADCHVDPAGLWGPGVADLGPDKDKEIEKARGRAVAAVRANYKALTAATKDKPTIMGFAREQAQFSSTREEICRSYAEEGRHGYCATKVTEARAAELRDKLGVALVAKAERLAKKHGGRAAQRP